MIKVNDKVTWTTSGGKKLTGVVTQIIGGSGSIDGCIASIIADNQSPQELGRYRVSVDKLNKKK